MPLSALIPPTIDPTPLFEYFRGSYATELLVAATAHLRIFERLAKGPLPERQLQAEFGLADRPTVVLLTALRAMNLLERDATGKIGLTPIAKEHVVSSEYFDVSNYFGLAAESPGVLQMVERLRTNRPAGAEKQDSGAAFIFREGIESAMEKEASARHFTLALSGRAKNVAPSLAQNLHLEDVTTLLDVGGGTGIYSIACLQKNPRLRAIVWDRPEVLKVAEEFSREYGVQDRLECRPGDMFTDPVPNADMVLLSNILHDWDVPQCRDLVDRCSSVLRPGNRFVIHDVYLNDDLSGPLPIALYSAALFTLTEGRAYSAAEYGIWLKAANLTPGQVIPTSIHCGLLIGEKGE